MGPNRASIAQKSHHPADAAIPTDKLPWKDADVAPPSQNQIDVSPDVFNMRNVAGKGDPMHTEPEFGWKDLVGRPAGLFLELLNQVGSSSSYRPIVHGVIG